MEHHYPEIDAEKLQKLVCNIHTNQQLNLNGYALGDEAFEPILASIQKSQTLTELTLAGNNLTDKTIIKLMKFLGTNKTIRKLSVSGNNITENSAQSISEMLKQNTHLEQLYLHMNGINSAGMEQIVSPLTNSHLKILHVHLNPITLQASKAIIDILHQNYSLIDLEISIGTNQVESIDRQKIIKLLSRNRIYQQQRLSECKSIVKKARIMIYFTLFLPVEIVHLIASVGHCHITEKELSLIYPVLFNRRLIGTLTFNKEYSSSNLIADCLEINASINKESY
jgi:hypothetical protein